jgi:hypothetical protein
MFDALKFIADWLNSGVYTFFTEAFAYLVQVFTLAYLEFMLWAVPFGWGVAVTILDNLNLNAELQSYWNMLDGDSKSMLSVMRIPEAFQTLLTAGATKIVMKFIPGVG